MVYCVRINFEPVLHNIEKNLLLKNNGHDTFLVCRNCRGDRTRVYLDDTVVTVVNCCQRVATRLFFMFPFGRKNYSDDTYNTFATVTTMWKPGLISIGNHAMASIQLEINSTSDVWKSCQNWTSRRGESNLANFQTSRILLIPNCTSNIA